MSASARTVSSSGSLARRRARSSSSTRRQTSRWPRSTSAVGRGSVAFLPDGTRAFVPSETTGKITEVDTATYKIATDDRAAGGIAADGHGDGRQRKRLFVSNGRAGTVCVLDPAAGNVLHTIPVGKRPWGLGLSPRWQAAVCGQRAVGRHLGRSTQ